MDDDLAETVMKFNTIGQVLRCQYLGLDSEMKKECLELFFQTLEVRNSRLLIDYTTVASGLISMNGKNSKLEPKKNRSQKELKGSRNAEFLNGGA